MALPPPAAPWRRRRGAGEVPAAALHLRRRNRPWRNWRQLHLAARCYGPPSAGVAGGGAQCLLLAVAEVALLTLYLCRRCCDACYADGRGTSGKQQRTRCPLPSSSVRLRRRSRRRRDCLWSSVDRQVGSTCPLPPLGFTYASEPQRCVRDFCSSLSELSDSSFDEF